MPIPRIRSLGLDGGSHNLGYGIVDIDLETAHYDALVTCVLSMGSLNVDSIVPDHLSRWQYRTQRQQRLRSCGDYAVGLIQEYDPDIVVIEDAYLNRRQPLSYRSLSEGIIYLTEAIYDYDALLPVIIVEAIKAKKAVGAKPKRGCDQKKIVRDALLNNRDIILPDDFNEYPQDAVDGVALAQYGLQEWWEDNKWFYR